MIDVAVVGTGHLGTIHAKLWAANDRARLKAIVDPDEAKGRSVAEQHSATWYPSLSEMPTVDAVTIAAPTSLHHALALDVLHRGMHCFMEKPITATYEEALDVIAAANAADRVVQVGHVERFNPAIAALHGFDVHPLFIEAHRLASFKPRAIDVSVIHDLMIHDIDLILWLTKSKVESVEATGVAVLTDTPDICNARITFENGCVANLTASRISAKPMRKVRVFQRDSYVSLDLAEATIELYRLVDTSAVDPAHQMPLGTVSTKHGDRMIVFDLRPVPERNAIAEEQNAFLDSIASGALAAVTADEGAEAVRIAELVAARVDDALRRIA
jgi:predicted dehydrogenase